MGGLSSRLTPAHTGDSCCRLSLWPGCPVVSTHTLDAEARGVRAGGPQA